MDKHKETESTKQLSTKPASVRQRRHRTKRKQDLRDIHELRAEKKQLEYAQQLDRHYADLVEEIKKSKFLLDFKSITGSSWDRSIESNRSEVISRVAAYMQKRDQHETSFFPGAADRQAMRR